MWCHWVDLLLDASWNQLECWTTFVIPFRSFVSIFIVHLVLMLISYAITLILCIVLDTTLIRNSNRPGKLLIRQPLSASSENSSFPAGFLALAQFPIIFLFATKNSLVSLVLGPGNGYEKLNFVHRWSGRGMFLGSVLHGSLWIRKRVRDGIPIIGHRKETTGIAALGILGVIVISSIKPVRRICYEIFSIIQ